MSTCLLCQEQEGQMEFNMPTRLGMIVALICLDCWANLGDDSRVALTIIEQRRLRAISKFNLPPDIIDHWGDVPEEQRPEIQKFLMQGVGE